MSFIRQYLNKTSPNLTKVHPFAQKKSRIMLSSPPSFIISLFLVYKVNIDKNIEGKIVSNAL